VPVPAPGRFVRRRGAWATTVVCHVNQGNAATSDLTIEQATVVAVNGVQRPLHLLS